MAVRKRRVRKLKSSFFALIICMFSFVLYLISALFLRTYNVSLSRQLQTANAEIETYTRANAAIAIEIQQLSTMDRVMAIADEENMTQNPDSVISISNER